MPKKALTDQFIKGAKPKGQKWVEYWDTKEPGLLLIVSPKGNKSFAFRYRRASDSKKRKITIGPTTDVGLSDARIAAAGYRAHVRAGEDPAHHKTSAAHAARRVHTFKDLSRRYIERHAKPNKKSWLGDQRSLDRDILPAIGEMGLGDIKKRDVLDVIDAVADRGSPIMANRTLAVIRGIFRWAEAEDLIEHAPIHGIRPRGIERSRDRVLTAKEIPTFLSKLDTLQITAPVRDIMQLVLVLGQRVSEVAGAEVEEIKLEDAEWTIPRERTKNRKRHTVPLPTLAVEIFQRNISPNERYVFPSPFGKRGHIGSHAPQRALYRARSQFGLDRFTVHDLRRTAATGMSELGVPPHVVEAVLNHISGHKGGIAGVYNRAEYIDEKRHALESWAAQLEELKPSLQEARR